LEIFLRLYKEHDIYTLYIPLHSSHLLQPLNVSYFALLKEEYSRKVVELTRHYINYITKLKFLLAFKAAF